MSTSLPVNAQTVATRIATSGMSENHLTSAGALGKLSLRYLRSGKVHKNTSLADMQRILDTLDMSWGEMFDNTEPDPPQLTALPDPDRVQLLSELLIGHTGPALHHDQLCIVFGTTIDQLRADMEQVSDQLSGCGIRVDFTTAGVIHVRRTKNAARDRASIQLQNLVEAEKGSNFSALQLLHRAAFGGLSIQTPTNNQRVQIGLLSNRRLVEPAGPYTVTATKEVMYAFDVD